MTFRKTVLAYLTGWLIVQPLYNRLFAWWRRREMEKPDGEYRTHLRELAAEVAEAIERRKRLPVVCPRCKMPYRDTGGHGPGLCIERELVDVKPMPPGAITSLHEAAEAIIEHPVDDDATIAAAARLLEAHREWDPSPAGTRHLARMQDELRRCVHDGDWAAGQ